MYISTEFTSNESLTTIHAETNVADQLLVTFSPTRNINVCPGNSPFRTTVYIKYFTCQESVLY